MNDALDNIKKDFHNEAFSYSASFAEVDKLLAQDKIKAPWLKSILDNNLDQMQAFHATSEALIDKLIYLCRAQNMENQLLKSWIEMEVTKDEHMLEKFVNYASK